MSVVHPKTDYLRFTVSGSDNGRYPSFNGQFTKIAFNTQKGAFISSSE